MNDTTPQTSSFFNDEERFKQIVSILIAVVTVITAVVGLLQNDAGSRDDRANRVAQDFAFQAMGQRISGVARAGYDRGDAYRNLSELAALATSAENAGDDAAAQRYLAVAEEITQLSPLLAPPYFDPAVDGQPNLAKYEAETYLVNVTGLAERSAAWFAVKQAWDEKANTYVVHITILAVALFLFGLALTLSSQVRWIFVIAGLVISLIAVGWALSVYWGQVPYLPEQAIDAYAQGVGLAHQGDDQGAIKAFDEAIAQAPEYANALFDRGVAQANLGDFPAAITNFEAARAAGRDDASVAWNLAWVYYLQGRFDDAVQTNRRTVELDPGLLEARFDLGLAMLAAGQIEAARNEYTQGVALATEQVAKAEAANQEPPASLWWSFENSAAALDGLIDRIDGFEDSWWSATPPLDKITNPEAVQAAAEEIVHQLKGNSVALEYTGQPLAGSPTAQITPFEFAEAEYDDEGNIAQYNVTDLFPAGTQEVYITFDYENMRDDQEVVYKVYYNGEEDPSWRNIEKWSLGASGSAEYPLSYAYSNVYTLASGEYLAEMYVNSHLVQRGYFYIAEPDAEASATE
jgi:tetratricopeptide (TPR) repeat protein